MLVNTSSLIAIQSYSQHQTLDRSGTTTDRGSAAPGTLSRTAQRGLREPFVLVDLSDDAAAKLAAKAKQPNATNSAQESESAAADPPQNKFLREAPKANAQPALSRPGTHLDISV